MNTGISFRRRVLSFAIACAAMGAVACGGGEGTPDNGGTDEGGIDTATAGNPHDYWAGADWDTFFPAAGETATYQVTTFSQTQKTLMARVVEDAAFKGGNWSKIVVGDLEPGKDGTAIYFDKSTPWVIKAKGIEVFSADVPDGPMMTEWFDDTLDIPLNKDVGEKTTISTEINGEYNGFADKMDVTYEIEWETFDAEVTVPAGVYDGCAILKATLGGELIGGTPLILRIKLHPDQKIIFWEDSPGFTLVELQTDWM